MYRLAFQALTLTATTVLLFGIPTPPRAAEKVAAVAPSKIEYNRDVRPILAENCFACHGPDSAARKADLRLDRREDAVKAGALTPGDPSKSELIARILLPDGDEEAMPPRKSHKTLSVAQKDVLKAWVAAGAEYQSHWSFIAPKRPTPPAVKDAAWVRTPIDRFILAELEKNGLAPAPEADRRTLARRVSLDLTGLPPEPAAVEAFVTDKAADAYEKYVDAVLASPHWGEHRGRYWLDAARYGDTHGIHFDNFREMWSYRDWVIRALNDNMPFDRFTVEQLAGDLLPDRTVDQQVATGFVRCNITTNEGGAISEEYLVLYARDRTETASQVWMGLTTGCAVCHDHKFDPVSTKDFYSLSAFFNNTTQGAMDGNISNTPPVVTVARPEDRAKLVAVSKELGDLKAKLDSRKAAARKDFDAWAKTAGPVAAGATLPAAPPAFHARFNEGKGKTVSVEVAGKARPVTLDSGFGWAGDKEKKRTGFAVQPGKTLEVAEAGDFDRDQAFAVSAWVNPTRRNLRGALVARMDPSKAHRGWDLWAEGDRVGMHIVHDWNGQNALKVVAKNQLPLNKWTHVTAVYDGTGKAAGVRVYYDGEPQPVQVDVDGLKDTIRTSVPLSVGQRHNADRVQNVALQDVRIYAGSLTAAEAGGLAKSSRAADLLAKPAAKRTAKETGELFEWWLDGFDPEYKTLDAKRDELRKVEVAIQGRGTIAHVAQEKPTEPVAYVLNRGEYDQRRDKVGPATPKALPEMPADLPRNRLGLARWLLRDDHPLTARVTVNRFWQELYGNGLVRTAGDFGITGELPSHPELLDWLAVEFRESGWDMKKFFKLLVTSAAYRQAAVTTPEKREKDRDNRLLSRGPRYRMDAEMVRDHALAASGLLVRKLGGSSVKPYQPEGVWEAVAMPGSNTRNYKQDSGEGLYRRSMYTFWKRAAPPASMEIFNAPNRETCAVRRERTNTPIQALATLNDVQFVEAARVLAEKALAAGGADDDRLDFVARRLLARPFTADEKPIVSASLAGLVAEYKEKPADAAKLIAFGESKADPKLDAPTLAAWTMLVNELMNLDEVLCK